jgi:hypothetical protein
MKLVRTLFLVLIWSGSPATQAQESVSLKFTLDWLIDGQQTPFFLTQGKGYFTQQRLNVTLDVGTGSAAAVQRVASGTYDMGYGDTSALIEYLSKNPAQEEQHLEPEGPGRQDDRRTIVRCRPQAVPGLRQSPGDRSCERQVADPAAWTQPDTTGTRPDRRRFRIPELRVRAV